MSKLKVYMAESWYTYRNSHTIEIDTDDYEELKGMTDEEAFEYPVARVKFELLLPKIYLVHFY